MRRLALLAVVLVLAGCGGGAKQATHVPPRLPRALAQSWARQADAVAAALAAGDGCTAQRLAGDLRTEVAEAAGRAPRRLLAPLSAAVDGLAGQITCTPPPTTTQKNPHPKPPKTPPTKKHGHGKKKH